MKLFIKRCRIELITITILLLIGTLFIVLSRDALIQLLSYLLGLFFIITATLILVTTIKNKAQEEPNLFFLITQGVVVLILGICVIIFKRYFLRFIIGLLILIIPITRLILSKNRKSQLIKELPKIIIGVILVFSMSQLIKILFACLGIVLIIFSGVLLFLTIKSYRQNKHNSFFYRIFTNTILRL